MHKDRYNRRKEELLNDKSINAKNRAVITEFLTFEEYKLKRKQGLAEVDEKSYKTLYFYISRLRNLNKWFDNKEWAHLTEKDIKKLIDDLEDGVIRTKRGDRFSDRSLYYNMIQGRLFQIVKKNHIAREILEEFSIKGREHKDNVRFITEETFRKIVDNALNPVQKCLLWLAFDVGENIGSLLELTKDDVKRQQNTDTGEAEYLVILSKDMLKRSRTPRSELTNYPETTKYLDIVIENLKLATKQTANLYDTKRLFKFERKSAESFLRRAVDKVGARCLPAGDKIVWKDLRSSMACDLLNKGWTTDEVNSRLGHKPSSRMIDKYVTYLALDRHKPKKKVYETNLRKMEADFEKQKEVTKLQGLRIEHLKTQTETLAKSNKKAFEQIRELVKIIKTKD